MDYAFKGGFPELVNEEREEKILSYIREIVLDRIILIDIPEEFGVRDLSLLKTLVEMVASDPGLILNYDSLSRKLGKSKPDSDQLYFVPVVFPCSQNHKKPETWIPCNVQKNAKNIFHEQCISVSHQRSGL